MLRCAGPSAGVPRGSEAWFRRCAGPVPAGGIPPALRAVSSAPADPRSVLVGCHLQCSGCGGWPDVRRPTRAPSPCLCMPDSSFPQYHLLEESWHPPPPAHTHEKKSTCPAKIGGSGKLCSYLYWGLMSVGGHPGHPPSFSSALLYFHLISTIIRILCPVLYGIAISVRSYRRDM